VVGLEFSLSPAMASRGGALRCHAPSRPTIFVPVWPHQQLPRVAAARLPHNFRLVCALTERAQRRKAQIDHQTPRRLPGTSFLNCSTSRTHLSASGHRDSRRQSAVRGLPR